MHIAHWYTDIAVNALALKVLVVEKYVRIVVVFLFSYGTALRIMRSFPSQCSLAVESVGSGCKYIRYNQVARTHALCKIGFRSDRG